MRPETGNLSRGFQSRGSRVERRGLDGGRQSRESRVEGRKSEGNHMFHFRFPNFQLPTSIFQMVADHVSKEMIGLSEHGKTTGHWNHQD